MTMVIPSGASAPPLEIAHVLFMDIVAYSTLPMDKQHQVLSKLQQAVRSAAHIGCGHPQDDLITLPTGDGMALVFFGCPESPVRCALDLTRALREHPEIKLRIGIHTGPVYRVADINQARNVAGGAINMAQRVMDCADAGHILVSKPVADILVQLSDWKSVVLDDLGEAQVKHGVHVHIFNLHSDEVGNREQPQRLKTARQATAAASRKKRWLAASAIVALVAIVAGLMYYRLRQTPRLTEKDTIVISEFANKTGDPVFDETLKTGLTVALSQSPFLNVLSDQKVIQTLKLMTRPPETKLTPEVAREVCLRANSKAYIVGSIANLGNEYVIALQAINCHSGDAPAQEQVTANGKEKVLDAVGDAAAKLRAQLGESLASVRRTDLPLQEATTSSLEALQAYSQGLRTGDQRGYAAALGNFQRAIELDPNFAVAYLAIANTYFAMGEMSEANEYFTKAFQLRTHASERDQNLIAAQYYFTVTGQLDLAVHAYEQILAAYPAYEYAWGLAQVYAMQGLYERAVQVFGQERQLIEDNVGASEELANCLLALGRRDEAAKVIQEAQRRGLDDYIQHEARYALAFLTRDSSTMANEMQWFADNPALEDNGLSLSADTEAYFGHLQKARGLTARAINSAARADSKENAALWHENAALREVAFGNTALAKQAADAGVKLYSDSQSIQVEAALAYAMSGDAQQAELMAKDLDKRNAVNVQIQALWLPAVNAQLALNRDLAMQAVEQLQRVVPPIEYGQIAFLSQTSCLYPTYIRGQAYLAAGQGKEAAVEFQKILDHSGIVWNCWTGALARLDIARANALQAKSATAVDADAARLRAVAAYQAFLALWQDADPDIPIYEQAKAEYAKLP